MTSQPPASTPLADTEADTQLLALDASVDVLASDGDFDTLAGLLADDFHYIHSTGLTQSKTEWIDGLRKLVGQRRRLVSGSKVDAHGDVAIVIGDLDVVWNDGRIALDRYVRVYRASGQGWRVIFQRTLPAPDRAQPGAAH